MDTTVVFFPGMGYGVDRPLFYYARKQAQQTGSEVVCVDYPSFSPDPSVPAPLQAQAALPGCVNDALAQLAGRCLGRCVFVSKSLGTLVAGEVARRLALRPVQIYLTPLPRTCLLYTSNPVASLALPRSTGHYTVKEFRSLLGQSRFLQERKIDLDAVCTALRAYVTEKK